MTILMSTSAGSAIAVVKPDVAFQKQVLCVISRRIKLFKTDSSLMDILGSTTTATAQLGALRVGGVEVRGTHVGVVRLVLAVECTVAVLKFSAAVVTTIVVLHGLG